MELWNMFATTVHTYTHGRKRSKVRKPKYLSSDKYKEIVIHVYIYNYIYVYIYLQCYMIES